LNSKAMACAMVLGGLVAGALAACSVPIPSGGRSQLSGDPNLGALRVGGYNYVAACQAFEQEDFTAILGAEPPGATVRSTFAQKTYADDPYRIYRSQCEHLGLAVEIDHYPTPDQLTRGLNGIRGRHDKTASNALGLDETQVYTDPDEGTVTAVVDNKIVATRSNSASRDIPAATKLMKMVLRRLRDLAAHPPGPLDPTRPGASVAGRPYLSACAMLQPADYTQVLGVPADEGSIQAEMPVADTPPTTHSVRQDNTCAIDNVPDKQPRSPSAKEALSVFDVVTTHATVTVSQRTDAAEAASLLRGSDARPVTGLGDQAAYVDIVNGAGSQVRYLMVRKGANIAEFQVTHDKVGSSVPEGLDVLRRLAALCVPRMG
jgi:hypothetical protein